MEAAKPTLQRVASIDAFRGFVMLLMMAEVLNFSSVSEKLPESSFWSFIAWHQSHVPWIGCTLHDLIQPSFSFLVGMALPYSLASRSLQNQSSTQMWLHTLKRALILILLGIFLRSMHASQTNFTFEDTLTQIGLGYPFLFALGFRSTKTQWIALGAILIGYWLFFALYPLPDAYFDWSQTGHTAQWAHHMEGFSAHWNKNTNAAWAFDQWFMNLFPRENIFYYNHGGYSTLSFIPTLATMILGLIVGRSLKNSQIPKVFIKNQLYLAAGLLITAVILHFAGINPIVKRIWTPAWTLYSGGWAILILTFFYYVADVKGHKSWFSPLVTIGANSIAAYIMAHTLNDLIDQSFRIHLNPHYDQLFGLPYATLVSGMAILAIEYWILSWMYKKKLFIKI